ncbi:MAG: fatty acid desaturase [Candidatus Sungbacteria bacterium]|nr:fatty acid desaturase [bacterium]MDZ4260535.1 fatty acid desaturase [Candidatus Sungbacteria bacterium]
MEAVETKFIELKQRITREGLLEKRPFYYIYKSCVVFLLLAISIGIAIVAHSTWIRMLDAVFLAIAYTQIGLIAHDISHNQVFHSPKRSRFFGILFWNFALGTSFGLWNKKHNAHHANPNQIDKDFDIDQPMIFTKTQYQRAHPILKTLYRYQQFYFFPMLLLVYFSVVINGIQFFIRDTKERGYIPLAEVLAFALHHAIFLTAVFFGFGFWQGLLFTMIHHLTAGFIFGIVAVTNHNGMPIFEKEIPSIFLQQIITSRNLRSNLLVNFWYGGLDYQIEHHLFPTMPRKNLKKTQVFVKQFCATNNIPYHETGVIQSYVEILKGLKPMQV